MQSELKCPRCGAALPPDAPQGNCPACLLRLALAPAAEAAAGPPDGEPTAWPGSTNSVHYFGDYELQREIARGGMGVVFRARQVSLNRPVALKMILAGQLATPAQVRRFQVEAEAAGKLDHPNIVPIYEIGRHECHHFYSMKLVEGGNLARWIEEGRWRMEGGRNSAPVISSRLPPPAWSAKLIATVARAVHYAHQHGILHRDLKPTNILLGADEAPLLTDFGLAKVLADDNNATGTFAVLGSPSYMAPEQAAGRGRQLTTAADVYSLGAILYELLSGRPPFREATALETMRQVVDQEPARPSELNPELDPDLETICLKCLQKDPDARYASALALAEDLDRWLGDETILARPAGAAEKLGRWMRRNPKLAALGATVILLLLTVAIGSTLAVFRIRSAHRAATEQLFDSYVAQARARRRDSREGQRFDSLETAARAATIHSSLELRSEAIACLAMTDVRFVEAHDSPDPESECWNAGLDLRAFRKPVGLISVRRTRDDREVALLPSLGAGALAPHGFSPDGHYLAVSYANGRHVVWDVEQQQLAISDIPHARSADFSADGQTVAVSCGDGQLRRFGLNPIRPLPSLPVNPRYHGIRLRPQGDWFAGYEMDKADLEVCDLRDGSLRRTLSHPSHIGTFAWSSDGRSLAVGCENGRIFIWNALTGEKQNELEGHEDMVTSVGFSHTGWLLASTSWDGRFKLWDLAAGRRLLTTTGWSYQAAFSPDDRRIGLLQRGRVTGSLEVTASSSFHRLHCKASPLRGSWSTDISPDGRLVAAAFSEGVHLWADQRPEEPFFLPVAGCFSVMFTPDGTSLITCGGSGAARWPLQRLPGTKTDELRIGPRQSIREAHNFNYAALSLDGRWLAAANFPADAVSIYEVSSPTNHFRLVSQPRIQCPAISPDGRWVAAGNFKGSGVKVWEFESRRVVCTLPAPSSAWVAFSPDKRWLLTTGASYDLWETGSWKHKYKLTRPGAEWASSPLAFSPDAITLAITREPSVIQLVLAETGEVLANLEAPRASNISFLRFSPDGGQLFALELDQQVQVWDLRRLRAELRDLNLDWNSPLIPAAVTSANLDPKPLRISRQ
jgi:eukaryotic-like serine/threonine-protein kinase